MKYCPNCGNTLEEGAAFCNKCGASLASETAAPTPTAPTLNTDGGCKENLHKKKLDTLHVRLKREKTSFLVLGIIATVLSVLMIISAISTAALVGTLVAAGADFGYEYSDDYDYSFEGADFDEDDDYGFEFGDFDEDDYDYDYDDDYDFDYDYDYDFGDGIVVDDFFTGDFTDDLFNSDDFEQMGVAIVAGFAAVAVIISVIGAILLLVSGIISLVKASKLNRAIEKLYVDCTDAVEFCSKGGNLALLIIMSILFWEINVITLFFHVINRAKVIDDADIYAEIAAEQKARNGVRF